MADSKTPNAAEPLHFALHLGADYGWGQCARALLAGLQRRRPVEVITDPKFPGPVKGTVFHQCSGPGLDPAFAVRGERNIGYTFLEWPLARDAARRASAFDLVLAGSTDCWERLEEAQIPSATLVQGIDPERFAPLPPAPTTGPFVLYSGGKLEFRKGQDVVLAACKQLMPRHQSLILVANWGNLWPETMRSLEHSPHVRYRHDPSRSAEEATRSMVQELGLPAERVVFTGVLPHGDLRELFAVTHMGVFPNRGEGGTNLVLMEYMATGRPVIATRATGHRDVIDGEVAIPLVEHRPLVIRDPTHGTEAVWAEPSVEELVAAVDHAIAHRAEIAEIGRKGAARMRERFTWDHAAERLHRLIQSVEARAQHSAATG